MNREEAAANLANLIADNRTGGHVYMSGEHNPRPSETLAAQRFIDDLIEQGWQPGCDCGHGE